MTFSYVIKGREVFGTLKIVYGTYASTDFDSGGDISLNGEMHLIETFFVQPIGSTSGTTHVVNENFPADSTITIATETDGSGIWLAMGR